MTNPFPPFTRARAALLLDTVRMSVAEIEACHIRASQEARTVEAASAELYWGICKEMPPDIEIQPRIVRSA